jgi:hypothetical protein
VNINTAFGATCFLKPYMWVLLQLGALPYFPCNLVSASFSAVASASGAFTVTSGSTPVPFGFVIRFVEGSFLGWVPARNCSDLLWRRVSR